MGHVVQLHVNSHSIQVLYLISAQYDIEPNVCVTLPVADAYLSEYSLKHGGSIIHVNNAGTASVLTFAAFPSHLDLAHSPIAFSPKPCLGLSQPNVQPGS